MKEAQVKAEEERRQKLEVDAIDNIKAAEDLQRIENLIKQRVKNKIVFFLIQQYFPFFSKKNTKKNKKNSF